MTMQPFYSGRIEAQKDTGGLSEVKWPVKGHRNTNALNPKCVLSSLPPTVEQTHVIFSVHSFLMYINPIPSALIKIQNCRIPSLWPPWSERLNILMTNNQLESFSGTDI